MVPERRRPPTDPFRIARGLRGYAHRARSRAPSGKEIQPSLTRLQLSPRARGLARALGSQSMGQPSLVLGSCKAHDANQGPGTRRQALSYRCSGAPRRCSLGAALPTAPPTGSCPGRETRRQSFPRPPGDRGLPGPRVSPWSRPPSPPRRLQKVSPGGG